MNADYTEINASNKTQFAATTVPYDAVIRNGFERQLKRRMDYKDIAKYAASVIRNFDNLRFDGWGKPSWQGLSLCIRDVQGGVELIRFHSTGQIDYFPDFLLTRDEYAAAMYVIAAMKSARNEIVADSKREMTPAEIEAEFGLNRGVVRKHLHDHRELLVESGVARQADARTWLIKRGYALNKWGARSLVDR